MSADDDTPEAEPVEGEIITPGDDAKRAKAEAKAEKAEKAGKANRREIVRTSGQTKEQREEEEKKAEGFRKTALIGGINWRWPGWEPSDEERHMVRVGKFAGYTDEQIASALDMSVETMHKFFPKELKDGRFLMIGDLTSRAFVRAQQGDATLTMFLLKTRSDGKFSERALAVAALTEGAGRSELDETRRNELVRSLLDVLQPKKKPEKTPKEGKSDDSA